MTDTTEDRIEVCGLLLDDLTLPEAVERVGALVERGRADRTTHQVVTVNVDFVVTASDEPDVRTILRGADVALADGMPLVWASRLLGTPVRERTSGADLVPALAAAAAARGHRLGLFGGAPGVAGGAAERLRARHPALDVHATSGPMVAADGGMAPQDERAVLEELRAAAPDVLCVALGHPKQERFIARWREQLGVPVLVGVGGSLDFVVGATVRAPAWMQRSGTEWVHRLLSEPARLGPRYAKDLVRFPPHVLRDLRARRASVEAGTTSRRTP